MKLTKIKIKKFKKIDQIELPISDLNILVGKNGSGKSSILQATHLASCLLRQAPRIRPNDTSIVNIKDLDYLPSDEYWRLGHDGDWGNQQTSPQSEMTFVFTDQNGHQVVATCSARSARNAGISVKGILPEEVKTLFRGGNKYFSGFIPGISGIPNEESKQSKKVVMKACSFGDSNVYLRNALNLLAQGDVQNIESWLSPLMGDVSIDINFNEDKDFVINAEITLNGSTHPLELLGTGYIQLIQIFCYILLFRPKILLIDEPDIHLHPDVQEKLASSLVQIAQQMDVKILLSTHSPFIIRGAPIDTNIYWLDDGKLETNDRKAAEQALGWGVFGKKIIIVSEDKDISFLKKLVEQWPEIEEFVAFQPGRGYKNLLKLDQAQELYETLGKKYKLVVHRDRDSLNDEEVAQLTANYTSEGILLWITEYSDIESYFCLPEFICNLVGCTQKEAEKYLSTVLGKNTTPISDKFNSQRRSHNEELHSAGGSPKNDDVWDGFQNRHLKGAQGKYVLRQLKNTVPGNKYSEVSILKHRIGVDLAKTLKSTLKGLL